MEGKGGDFIEMIPVQSSDLSAVGYEDGTLQIYFHSGGVYRFIHIPEAEYRALLLAPSKGKYFHAHIEGKYPFQRMQ